MKTIFRLSEELNKALLDSKEYQVYKNAEKALKEQRELYDAVNAFRKRNRQIQMYASDETVFDEMNQLTTEYGTVLRNHLVEEFLIAEQRLCRMMQDVYVLIGKNLEFDDEYMEG